MRPSRRRFNIRSSCDRVMNGDKCCPRVCEFDSMDTVKSVLAKYHNNAYTYNRGQNFAIIRTVHAEHFPVDYKTTVGSVSSASLLAFDESVGIHDH